MKAEPAVLESALECGDELAAKDATEHLDGEKEVATGVDPTRALGGEATGRHHAMHMGVEFKFLTPSMQHAEETDFCAEMFWIACNFDKCFRTGAKQEIVYGLLVLQRQWGQLTG